MRPPGQMNDNVDARQQSLPLIIVSDVADRLYPVRRSGSTNANDIVTDGAKKVAKCPADKPVCAGNQYRSDRGSQLKTPGASVTLHDRL